MDINTLLKNEAKATSTLQGRFKSIIVNAVRKHGLNRAKIDAEIKPKIAKLAKDNTDLFLKMGVNWLK